MLSEDVYSILFLYGRDRKGSVIGLAFASSASILFHLVCHASSETCRPGDISAANQITSKIIANSVSQYFTDFTTHFINHILVRD